MTPATEPLLEPPRLARRRSDGAEGRTTRDRLTTMLVLAALLHGLIILGISFTAPGSRGGADRGLEVLLVSDELPTAQHNDTATYLAQRTQLGSGNTQERLPAQLPARGDAPTPPGSEEHDASGRPVDQVLTTTGAARTRIQMLPLPPALAHLTVAELEEAINTEAYHAGDDELRLRGEKRDEFYLSADTRASPFAPYLDGWRRRVEQIGTINYPNAARRDGLTGSPVVEVTILADGRLGHAHIQRASGHPELDAAALDILRLANPFDPFPPELARDYRSLRFAYEWKFESGQPTRSSVTVP